MFGIGFYEFVVIFVLVVFLVNPKDLPAFFYKIGKLFSKAKRILFDLKEKFDNMSDEIKEDADLKSWEYKVENMRDEYNKLMDSSDDRCIYQNAEMYSLDNIPNVGDKKVKRKQNKKAKKD